MLDGDSSKDVYNVEWKSAPLTPGVIDDLEKGWTDLADHSVEQNVFFRPWFIRASLPLLATDTPSVVTIYQNDQLIGLILMRDDRGFARLPFHFFRSSLHQHQFLATPLIRTGCTAAFMRGLCNWVDCFASTCSFMLLTNFTGTDEFLGDITTVCNEQDRRFFLMDEFSRPGINLKTRKDDRVDQHISASRRKSLRRKSRQLAELGDVKIEKFSAENESADWIEDFLRLEDMGWKKTGGTSIKSDPVETTFYRQLVRAAARNNALSFFRLTVNETPIAYTLDFVSGADVYCVKCAFDPAFKKFSPGVYMEYESLKYYNGSASVRFVDSCTSPENAVLNNLWPDKKPIVSIAICRKGLINEVQFATIIFLKNIVDLATALARRIGNLGSFTVK